MENGKRKNVKRYYHKFPTFVYVFYGVFCAALLASAIYNILRATQVAGLVSYYPSLEISSAAVCLVAIGFLTFVLFSNCYIISDSAVIRQQLVKKYYPKEKLLTIKVDYKSGLIVLYVEDDTKEDYMDYLVILVGSKYTNKIIDDIRELNSHVSVEKVSIENE